MAHLNLQAIVIGGFLGLRILVSSITTTIFESANSKILAGHGRSSVGDDSYIRNLRLESLQL
jgi:hypothetical protein